MRWFSFLVIVLTLATVGGAFAWTHGGSGSGSGGGGGGDPTAGLLPAPNDVLTNWKMAGMQSVGGIPTRNTQCGATLNPLGGTTDDTAQIQAAIEACPAGQVVQLGAGTFRVAMANQINLDKSITLRGTGSCTSPGAPYGNTLPSIPPYCQTMILKPDGVLPYLPGPTCGTNTSSETGCIYNPAIHVGSIIGLNWSGCLNGLVDTSNCAGTYANLTADATQGQTTIQVNRTDIFSVGMWVLIDEASGAHWINDPLDAVGASNGQLWVADDFLTSSPSPATGRVEWKKHTTNAFGADDFDVGRYPYGANSDPDNGGNPGCIGAAWTQCDRATAELHLISAIGAGPCPGVNCTLTFDSPLTVAFRLSGGASFQGYISGTTLTVTSMTSGTILIDQPLSWSTITNVNAITAFGTGTGGVGTYTVSSSITLGSAGSPVAITAGAHNAHVYYPTNQDAGTYVPLLQNAGVENISIERPVAGGVNFEGCAYCWAQKVDVCCMSQGLTSIFSSARIEINEVYGHDTWDDECNGSEYPINLRNGSTEILVINSITNFNGKGMVAQGSGGGSVVAYNYLDDEYYQAVGNCGGSNVVDSSLNASHFSGSHHILFEGNWAVNFSNDHEHGNNTYLTYFRNYANAYRTPFTDPSNGSTYNDYTGVSYDGAAFPIHGGGASAYNYWHAYIGNVLGASGHSTTANGWIYQSTSATDVDEYDIWEVGDDADTVLNDPNIRVNGYLFRHGNYDYVTAGIVWDPGTPDHSLPPSFYLTSAPSFFSAGASCTYPWPWVTPTGSSQLQPNSCSGSGLPAKARWDAGTPFVQP